MRLLYPQKDTGLYILSRKDIDDIAIGVLKENMPYVLEYPQPVDIEYLAKECYYLSIQEQYITADGTILGLIAFGKTELNIFNSYYLPVKIEVDEASVIIDKNLFWHDKQRSLMRFTIGHETAHWLLHRSYHSPTNQQFQLRANNNRQSVYIACRSDNIESNKKRKLVTDSDFEEWQADCLSAALLMPIDVFTQAVENIFSKMGIRDSYIIKNTGNRPYNRKNEYVVKMYLSELFKVSLKAVEIRMMHLGFLK